MKKQVMKWTNRIATSLLFVLLISVALMVTITKVSGGEPKFFGYQLKTVLSGSMEPGIQTGSIIAVEPGGDMTRFTENDVITYRNDEQTLVTHRIVEVIQSGEHTMYVTKGDNNNAADLNPVLSENVVAEYSGFTIPYVGYIVNVAQSKNGAFLLIIPGLLLLMYATFTIWTTLTKLEVAQKEKTSKPVEREKRLPS